MKRGYIYKSDNLFGYAGWPTVGRLSDGRLACVFSGNRIRHVCPFGKTVISYSYDEGETWTPPAPVIDTAFDDRDGGIIARGNQVLVTSFNNNYLMQRDEADKYGGKEKQIVLDYIKLCEDVYDENDVCSSIAVSEDGGNTFPKRYEVPISCPHGPIVLKDGRYFYVGRAFGIKEAWRTDKRSYDRLLPDALYYMFSDDGYNWTKPVEIPLGPAGDINLFCEPHAMQLSNGEILVHIRVQGPNWGRMYTYQTISSENITKWEIPHDVGFAGSPPHLLRHSSGKIICVYGVREDIILPKGEYASVSSDEGKTWGEPIALDTEAPDGDLGYPSSVELKDGKILTAYYQRKKPGEKNRVKYTIWELK